MLCRGSVFWSTLGRKLNFLLMPVSPSFYFFSVIQKCFQQTMSVKDEGPRNSDSGMEEESACDVWSLSPLFSDPRLRGQSRVNGHNCSQGEPLSGLGICSHSKFLRRISTHTLSEAVPTPLNLSRSIFFYQILGWDPWEILLWLNSRNIVLESLSLQYA